MEKFAIDYDRAKHKYFVRDMEKGIVVTPKYDDEDHCLRQIKLRTNYRGDFHTMPVTKLYEDKPAAPPSPPPYEPPPPDVKEDIYETSSQINDIIPNPQQQAVEKINRDLKDNEYICSRCQAVHREISNIGKKHLKYKV